MNVTTGSTLLDGILAGVLVAAIFCLSAWLWSKVLEDNDASH